eukprot:scaffold669_cov379-Prasinococcus_capsulatus_cf.AAC.6
MADDRQERVLVIDGHQDDDQHGMKAAPCLSSLIVGIEANGFIANIPGERYSQNPSEYSQVLLQERP